ncbi:MAG: hypothetical protein ABW321_29290, partial [Polyangiales bacterium]
GGGVLADYHRTGAYVLLGYRLPWFPLMPFFEIDRMDSGGFEYAQPGGLRTVTSLQAGLNYRPVPAVAFKAQYAHGIFAVSGAPNFETNSILTSVAWSF